MSVSLVVSFATLAVRALTGCSGISGGVGGLSSPLSFASGGDSGADASGDGVVVDEDRLERRAVLVRGWSFRG